ncbi:MAG: hypothetical protein H5U40_11220, partial [Polyangiaceae bacterium]|nr:hypothetical protein [Polyangiaceae bacterium]
PDGTLRAGHFARARLVLEGTQELVRLPSTAVRERAGVERVYVIEGGVAIARIVTTVRREDEAVLVMGEIRPSDTIVIDPPRELADGASVRIAGAAGAQG